jgi:hypothetical protein
MMQYIGYQRNLHVSNERPVPMTYVACPEEKRDSAPSHSTPFFSFINSRKKRRIVVDLHI